MQSANATPWPTPADVVVWLDLFEDPQSARDSAQMRAANVTGTLTLFAFVIGSVVAPERRDVTPARCRHPNRDATAPPRRRANIPIKLVFDVPVIDDVRTIAVPVDRGIFDPKGLGKIQLFVQPGSTQGSGKVLFTGAIGDYGSSRVVKGREPAWRDIATPVACSVPGQRRVVCGLVVLVRDLNRVLGSLVPGRP